MKPEFIPKKRPLKFVRIVLSLMLFHLILAETSAQQTIPIVQSKDGFWTRDGDQQVIKFDSIDAADDGNDRITFYADEFRVLDPDDGRELFNLGGAWNDVIVEYGASLRFRWDNMATAYQMYNPEGSDEFRIQFSEPDNNGEFGRHFTVLRYTPNEADGTFYFPSHLVLQGEIKEGPTSINNPPKLTFNVRTEGPIPVKYNIQSNTEGLHFIKEHNDGAQENILELGNSGVKSWKGLTLATGLEVTNPSIGKIDIYQHEQDEFIIALDIIKGSHPDPNTEVASFGLKSSQITNKLNFRGTTDDPQTWQIANNGHALDIGLRKILPENVEELETKLKITDKYVVIRNDLNNSLTLDPTLDLAGGANFYSVHNIRIGAGLDNTSKGKAHIHITGGEKEPVLIRYDPTEVPKKREWKDPVKNGFALAVEKGILSEDLAIAAKEKWWADYVFEEDYQPMSLEELERFVKEEKHLPGIVSESEIEADGFYQVHDAMVGQLKNLEEQVLHNIAQEKTIKEQAAQIKNLTQKLDQLEKLVQQLADEAGN